MISITEAMKILSNPPEAFTAPLRALALIHMTMWMKYPYDIDTCESATLAGLCKLTIDQFGDGAINTLPDEQSQLFQQFITVRQLFNLTSTLKAPTPDFAYFDDEEILVSDLEVIADIVRFLLWYDPQLADKRKAASLNKAQRLFSRSPFFRHGTSDVSRSTFSKLWGRYQLSSAYLYVNLRHFDGAYSLNPNRPTFYDEVLSHLAEPAKLQQYIRNVVWVHGRLNRILHQNAGAIPTFIPTLIQPLELEKIILPRHFYETSLSLKDHSDDDLAKPQFGRRSLKHS